jgi:hypothetical protein
MQLPDVFAAYQAQIGIPYWGHPIQWKNKDRRDAQSVKHELLVNVVWTNWYGICVSITYKKDRH